MEDKNKFAEFQRLYLTKIVPKLKNLEALRLDKLKQYRKVAFTVYFSLIMVYAVLFVLYCIYNDIIRYGLFDAFLLVNTIILVQTLSGFLRKARSKEYGALIKKELAKNLVEVFGNFDWHFQDYNMTVMPSRINSDNNIAKSNLFYDCSYFLNDDEFKGTYKDVNFQISETTIAYESVKKFHGILALFELNKPTKADTIALNKKDVPRRDLYITLILLFFSIILCILSYKHILFFLLFSIIGAITYLRIYHLVYYFTADKKYINFLEKIVLEDPKFNKRFEVYSSDQVEGRYLLTTAFMDRFYNLKTAFKAESIKCSFFEDKVMIAIETKSDLFEPADLFTSLKNPNKLYQFYRQINSIINIIDVLKLDIN